MSYLSGTGMVGGYADVDILHGCTIDAQAGQITVIVGPNGAGKSTAMKALFGLISLRGGAVTLKGEDITRLKPEARVAAGMSFVPQVNNVFPTLTVEENLEMGAVLKPETLKSGMDEVYDLFPAVWEKRHQCAGELSGGQRQQVAVARALMTRPDVLMLDEPTAGVSPIVVNELFNLVQKIAAKGLAVLMVEQNAQQALEIADMGYVLVQGRNRFTEKGSVLLADNDVRRSFLGG